MLFALSLVFSLLAVGVFLWRAPRGSLRRPLGASLGLTAACLALLGVILISTGCATITPGSDPIIVKTEDVLVNSLSAYETAMSLHYAASERETPDVYRAAELIRSTFPPAWRGLRAVKESYRLAKTKEPAKLREAVLLFLATLEADGPPKWKAAIRLIRLTFEADVPEPAPKRALLERREPRPFLLPSAVKLEEV